MDVLLVIDDSQSMAPLQAKLRPRLRTFMDRLSQIPGGLPDLHLAVISTSLGAGIYSNVPGCQPGTAGNQNGTFQHSAACTALPPDQHFLKSSGGMNNFTGDIADVFACISDIGTIGCGFEHQLESTRLALQRAVANDSENGGFLREDAYLAIIMLTNEDDCSVDAQSMLFNPDQYSVNGPLGGLQSYRCAEFGHICDQGPPPHMTSSDLMMTNCRSAENGKLVTVDGFVRFLFSLKNDPSRILVAVIGGPPKPYVVHPQNYMLPNGGTELQPTLAHACTQMTAGGAAPEYADPAVRLEQMVRAFGPNGIFESICAEDFGPMMTRIADNMVEP